MKTITEGLQKFENSGWGVLTRYAIILLIPLVIAGVWGTLDNRYLTQERVDEYMETLHKVRGEDMAQIYSRIEAVRMEAKSADDIVRSLESRLARIETQNELMLQSIKELRKN